MRRATFAWIILGTTVSQTANERAFERLIINLANTKPPYTDRPSPFWII